MKHVDDFFNMESDAMDTYFECSVCHEEKELEEVEVDDFGEFICKHCWHEWEAEKKHEEWEYWNAKL